MIIVIIIIHNNMTNSLAPLALGAGDDDRAVLDELLDALQETLLHRGRDYTIA